MKIAKYLIVKKGQVFITDKPMPVDFEGYEEALKSWRKEAYLVVNFTEICMQPNYILFSRGLQKLHTGIYNAPDGLVFELTEISSADGTESEQAAILSFKEPSKEEQKHDTPIINQLENTIVEWLKSGDENATNLAYQIFFKHIERKEPSSERPDFEKMANEHIPLPDTNDPDYGWTCEMQDAFIDGCEKIWNDHVLQRDKKIQYFENKAEYWEDAHAHLEVKLKTEIQSLEQEIERLREELKSKQ